MREDSACLAEKLIPYKKDNAIANLYSITEYLRTVAQKTYDSKEYLSNADKKYILSKVIQHYYKDNLAKQKVIHEMRHDLYELYKLLLFHSKGLNSEQIETIRKDYSIIESNIFGIYALFQASNRHNRKGETIGSLSTKWIINSSHLHLSSQGFLGSFS